MIRPKGKSRADEAINTRR